MPAKWFICPDKEQIEIKKCLEPGGCRMGERCATLAYLNLIGYDREWQGVSPSMAGTGPRNIYLKAVTDYVIDPNDRVFAALGTGVHGKLSIHRYNKNVLSEEPLSDDEMKGTADCLEDDENKTNHFILTDYKTSGSYKVAKWLGLVSETFEETILDKDNKPVLLKSGPNKGKPKTRQKKVITKDPAKTETKDVELQLNRYRIFFEQQGFPISKTQVQAIPRDGGTYIAKSRGIEKNLYIIPIKRMPNKEVLDFYRTLAHEVSEAFKTGYARQCNNWEAWNNRNRCNKFCEVREECTKMSKKNNEKWGYL